MVRSPYGSPSASMRAFICAFMAFRSTPPPAKRPPHAATGEEIGQRAAFRRGFRVQREMRPLDLHVVLGPELLNTHGTEVAPGSDVVGKDLERQWLAHATSFIASLKRRSTFRWPSGNVRPAPRGSAMPDVAPSAFHAFTCFTHPPAS